MANNLTAAERAFLKSRNVDPNKASQKNIDIAKAAVAAKEKAATSTATSTASSSGPKVRAGVNTTPAKIQPSGSGTGAKLSVDTSTGLLEKPAGYDDKANKYGTYEDYVYTAKSMDANNAVMSRDQYNAQMAAKAAAAAVPGGDRNSGGRGGSINSIAGNTTGAGNPANLIGAGNLASMFGGVEYDFNKIKAIYDAATNAAYATKRKEALASEAAYGDMLYGAGITARDAIRRSASQAVATGASRGLSAANELSSVLGLQQTGVQEATSLMQNRQKLSDEEAAAIAQNAATALTTSNAAKMGLANLSSNIYASDTQYGVGQLDYAARLDAALKALQGTTYTADQALKGTQVTSDANLASSKLAADANTQAAQAAAKANIEAAKISAAAYGKSSSGSGKTTTTVNAKTETDPWKLLAAAEKAGDIEKAVDIARSLGRSESEINALKKKMQAAKNAGSPVIKKFDPTYGMGGIVVPNSTGVTRTPKIDPTTGYIY